MLSHGVIQPSFGPRTRHFELREWERWGGKNCHAMNLVAWACLSGFFCLESSLIFLWLLHLGTLQSPPQELQPPSLLSSITEASDKAEHNRSLLRKASHMASLSHWKPTLPMGQWVHRTRTCLLCFSLHPSSPPSQCKWWLECSERIKQGALYQHILYEFILPLSLPLNFSSKLFSPWIPLLFPRNLSLSCLPHDVKAAKWRQWLCLFHHVPMPKILSGI